MLEWLVEQLEKDEIEDVTDEMLDRLIKDGKTVAVLFCKYIFWQKSDHKLPFPNLLKAIF